MVDPGLQLSTLFVLNEAGRIVSVREPNGSKGPLFVLVRGENSSAFACRVDVPEDVATAMAELVSGEPTHHHAERPKHAEAYMALCVGVTGARLPLGSSLALAFASPEAPVGSRAAVDHACVLIEDTLPLRRHFPEWTEIDLTERGPVVGLREGSDAVSICYCARRTEFAAEAGVESAPAFRDRGFGTRAVAEWRRVVRTSGRVALYSAFADNLASLRIAEKLGFLRYATDWSITESSTPEPSR